MAEKYSYYAKSKGSRKNRSEDTQSRGHSKHSKQNKYEVESKTPPLPTCSSSIEELLKQRRSLKMELERIENRAVSDLERYKSSKSDKKLKARFKYDSHDLHKKRHNSYNDNDLNIRKRSKHTIKELSPDHNEDNAHVDSEDEESIIEQRRIQRQRLLAKLNNSLEDKCNINSIVPKENSTVENSADHNSQQISQDKSDKTTTDMFSEIDDFALNNVPDRVMQDNVNNLHLSDNWDDSEGYYNIKVGDIINKRYTIKSTLGQGVFANVVRAQDNVKVNTEVAIKIVRNNDLMYKTGLKELAILKEIAESDPANKYHCVKLLDHFMHKRHLCLVLEPLNMDLRCVLKKYGKNKGINTKALMIYSRQLFLALKLLKNISIIHADIKPDNILVNENKNILKLCDFGSATKVDDNEPTPYLVSRFYRAPEIILGIPYNHGIDIWSTACTIYEMATGRILFTGNSNNKMLKCIMDVKGRMPTKLIRKGKFKDQHFNYNNNFLLHNKDEVTGRESIVEMCNINVLRDLYKELKKSSKNLSSNEEKKLLQLKELLDKMLMLDPNQRLSVTDCLRHSFIQDEFE